MVGGIDGNVWRGNWSEGLAPVGSRGKAPVGGQGQSPPEAEHFFTEYKSPYCSENVIRT